MRRVAIAGVLAMEPDVIVLDEPTAGLDPRGRKEIMNMFYALHKEKAIIDYSCYPQHGGCSTLCRPNCCDA